VAHKPCFLYGFDPDKYPPHNIIETKNDFIIELACAGFCKEDLRVTAEGKVITVSGKKAKKNQEDGLVY
jgi:HSP20 family molecular chaperone IbpA